MGVLHFGVHLQLEEIANALIKQSLEGVTSVEAKRDILTPWKERDRHSKEVYTSFGVPSPEIRSGIYHRAYNRRDKHLNSRDGVARGRRVPLYSADDAADKTNSNWL